MRISDWSSDVCSSDLAGGRTACRCGIGQHGRKGGVARERFRLLSAAREESSRIMSRRPPRRWREPGKRYAALKPPRAPPIREDGPCNAPNEPAPSSSWAASPPKQARSIAPPTLEPPSTAPSRLARAPPHPEGGRIGKRGAG